LGEIAKRLTHLLMVSRICVEVSERKRANKAKIQRQKILYFLLFTFYLLFFTSAAQASYLFLT